MDNLSNKAKIVLATVDMMKAIDTNSAVTSYAILDYISENEELADHPFLKDIPEVDFVDIIMEMNIKSVANLLSVLVNKGYLEKTNPISMKVNGEYKSLRLFYKK